MRLACSGLETFIASAAAWAKPWARRPRDTKWPPFYRCLSLLDFASYDQALGHARIR